MFSTVLCLGMIATAGSQPDAKALWARVEAAYRNASSYRDEGTAGALQFRTAFSRAHGIRIDGRMRNDSFVVFGQPRCIGHYIKSDTYRSGDDLRRCIAPGSVREISDAATIIPRLLMPELDPTGFANMTPTVKPEGALLLFEFRPPLSSFSHPRRSPHSADPELRTQPSCV